MEVGKGSTLVCFTDGLVEQENLQGAAYGEHRLQQLVEDERDARNRRPQYGHHCGLGGSTAARQNRPTIRPC